VRSYAECCIFITILIVVLPSIVILSVAEPSKPRVIQLILYHRRKCLHSKELQ
jgi:hypothetical protein